MTRAADATPYSYFFPSWRYTSILTFSLPLIILLILLPYQCIILLSIPIFQQTRQDGLHAGIGVAYDSGRVSLPGEYVLLRYAGVA